MTGHEGGELATDEQLASWCERFANYRLAPTREALCDWLSRFETHHRPLAHRILDAVSLVSELEIQQGYRQALTALPGWSRKGAEREGRWFFVGAGSAGESGPAMLRMFREANELTATGWQKFFVDVRELPGLGLTAFDNVVFVDDFAGTGKQMTDYWPIIQELVASEAKCYLILTALTTEAKDAIEEKTELHVISQITLPKAANIFSQECDLFSADDLELIEHYGQTAWPKFPRGFGACGLLFVLSHKTPNNSIPILHVNNERWVGPFPRNLLQAA